MNRQDTFMIRIGLWLIALFLLVNQPAHSQFAMGGVPVSAAESSSLRQGQTLEQATYRLSPVNEAAIMAQEEANQKMQGFRVLTFALTRPLNLSPANVGVLERVGGQALWRVRLVSPGAKSLGVQFRRLAIPQGGRIYLYNDKGDVRGAFTEAHNNAAHVLTCAPLEGEALTIEYDFPSSIQDPKPQDVPFEIDELYHDYRGIGRLYEEASMRVNGKGEPWFNKGWKSLTCAPQVAAFPSVKDQARSVLLMIVNGNAVCTGALINNTKNDGTPYVLTASHCMNNSYQQAGNVAYRNAAAQNTVFFFGFQTPVPELGIRATEELTLSGAEIVAYNETSDLCLLRITGLPGATPENPNGGKIPPYYNPYFSGWNALATPQGPYFGIHHPLASLKRYNQTSATIKIDDYHADQIHWKGHHWRIPIWDIGTTAGGSSGSPLFDKNGLIIGALTGGSSTCSSPTDDAYYAVTTNFKGNLPADKLLAPWLAPGNSSVMECKGYDPLAQMPLERHSYIIPNIYRQMVENANPDNNVSGLANLIELPADQRVLGFYLVMPPYKVQPQNFPKTDIKLAQHSADGSSKELVTVNMSMPKYIASLVGYNQFVPETRTLTDTVELFVPVVQPSGVGVNLPSGGTYRVSIETPDNDILGINAMRLANGLSGTSGAYVRDLKGNWTAANTGNPAYHGYYWIDVLTQPIHATSAPAEPTKAQQPVTIQCDGHAVVVTLHETAGLKNFNDPTLRFELYHMSGTRVVNKAITSTRTAFDLGGMVPPGVYVARVFYGGKWYSEKVSLIF